MIILDTSEDYRFFIATTALVQAGALAYHGRENSILHAAGTTILDRVLCLARLAGYVREDILRTLMADPERDCGRVIDEIQHLIEAFGADAFCEAMEDTSRAVGLELPAAPNSLFWGEP